jgi:lysophospholipase L1-like esterase
MEPTKTIVFVGDSITEGAADHEQGGWTRRVAAKLPADWHVVHAGISGNTILDILARLQNDVLSHKPDLIVLAVGINDSRHYPSHGNAKEVSLEDYAAGLERFAAATDGHKVVIVGLTPIDDARTTPIEEDLVYSQQGSLEYDATLREFADKYGFPYVAISSLYEEHGGAKELTNDGLHPTPAGHQIIADAVLPILLKS